MKKKSDKSKKSESLKGPMGHKKNHFLEGEKKKKGK
jgi:hypothetical protein